MCAPPGDRALRDVLTFDGSAANGGLLNAVQSLAAEEDFTVESEDLTQALEARLASAREDFAPTV